MKKLFIISLIVLLGSCTDQGEPIHYIIKNTSNYNLSFIAHDRMGNEQTTEIKKQESVILFSDLPPYDVSPFGGFDSITVFFENNKQLTYKPFNSSIECMNLIKTPFCPDSSYICKNNNCVFEIDHIEYMKAK